MNLESTFSSSEIKKTLVQASQQFEQVDKFFKTLMNKVEKSPSAAKLIKNNVNLVKQLEQYNETVEEIQKALAVYLQTKRVSFPRFFFLSDEELLDILANSDNKEII
jgi:dynein heavy chain